MNEREAIRISTVWLTLLVSVCIALQIWSIWGPQ